MNFLIDANLQDALSAFFKSAVTMLSTHWICPKETQLQMSRFWITRTKITAPLQQKILISVHPSSCETVPTNYY